MGRAGRWGVGAALWALVASCGAPPPPSPSAVIHADPEAVPEGDGFATPIRLDANDSQPRLTLVPTPPDPGAPPLAVEWSFAGAARRIVEGSRDSAELTVTTAGDRPLHVTLTVRNAEGGVATALESIAITAAEAEE